MKLPKAELVNAFQKTIWKYYLTGKRDMPWRNSKDPYKILVSEIMLQQTQVLRVIPKYEAFIKAFPNFSALSRAKLSDVLRLWQGLGYNRRAVSLWKAAREVMGKYGGVLPHTLEELDRLPSIGVATAGAILNYAFEIPTVFIETNIRRVFIHFFFPKKKSVSDRELFLFIEAALDRKKPREWHYALMDYGSMLKGQVVNPNRRSKHYAKQSQFEGSNRQIRGQILKILIENGSMTEKGLIQKLNLKDPRVLENITVLIKEGFLMKKKMYIELI